MDNKEIALQLTLKALDCNTIAFCTSLEGTKEAISAENAEKAKQISDFYNSILVAIDSLYLDEEL